MREPGPADPIDGPRLDVATTMRKAVPVLAASEKPVCCIEDDQIVGIVDREAVLLAIAEEEQLMSTITEAPLAFRSSRTLPWWRGKIVQVGAIIAVMWLAYRGWKSEYPWPNDLVWNGLQAKFDSVQTYLIDQRLEGGGGFLFTIFDGFRIFADNLVTWFNDLLIWLTWIGTTVAGTLLSWRFGGLRAAVWALAAFASFAVSGLWAESMETLALMLAAVGLSILIGVPLGIAAGRSRRFNRILTPFLDAAQIVPAFAYLMPVVLFFSIGYAAAVVATMIYAIPPCIRITALGIRRVPVNTVEAAASMGATGRQMLLKVQLPMSRRMLLLGLNQTILFALSMVVIAGLIGGGGLGAVVNSGLFSNPALAILAGVVIVVMAMAFDRITEAIADRTDPTKRHLDAAAKRRLRVESLVVTGSDRGHGRRGQGDRRERRLPAGGGRAAARGDRAGVAAGTDPEGARLRAGPDVVRLPHHGADRELHPRAPPPAAAGVPHGGAVVHDARRADADRLRDLGPAPGDHGVPHARADRLHGRLVARDGHALAGHRRDRHRGDPRLRPRRLGLREPHGLGRHAPRQRRAADPAAARLHHPVHLPDAGVDRPGDRGRGALRLPRRRPPRGARPQGRRAGGRRGGRCVRGDPRSDPVAR